MHNDPSSSQSSQIDTQSPVLSRVSSGAKSGESLARRRALLRGLGKGSAALALVVPIQTLAVTTIVGGTKLCTVSGVQSNVGSHHPGTVTTCQGNSPTYFQTLANWPGVSSSTPSRKTNTVDGITFTQVSTFAFVFGSGSSTALKDILAAASPPSPPPTQTTLDEAAWVTALLNALKNTSGFNFPYTPSQVRAFYTGGGTLKVQALAFFQGYMQTVG